MIRAGFHSERPIGTVVSVKWAYRLLWGQYRGPRRRWPGPLLGVGSVGAAPGQAGAYVHGLRDCSCYGAILNNASELGGRSSPLF